MADDAMTRAAEAAREAVRQSLARPARTHAQAADAAAGAVMAVRAALPGPLHIEGTFCDSVGGRVERADVATALALLERALTPGGPVNMAWQCDAEDLGRARDLLRSALVAPILAEEPMDEPRSPFVHSHDGSAALSAGFARGLADAGALDRLVGSLGPACAAPGCRHEHCALVRRARGVRDLAEGIPELA
jgi:hypothetical protein